MAASTNTALTDHDAKAEPPLTNATVAIVNLQAQIDGLESQLVAEQCATVSNRAELIELVALRGQILGLITDYEWAGEQAEKLPLDAPREAVAFIARARARGRFHRFTDALTDLEQAQELGADRAMVDTERAGVLQALGRYDQALILYNEAIERRADFETLGALATLRAEDGEIDAAERLFDDSRYRYRGVSPIPLALLDFRRGLMWLAQSELQRAHRWFETAVRLLPPYAPAQGHVAEVEAALGKPDTAIARLLPLTSSSDDPDYPASLARILVEADRVEEATPWRNKAAAKYDELMAHHPEAFADHAVEFWLGAGANPDRALWCARLNLEVRQTPRAHKLYTRAFVATGG